jgi:hypothetical protein
VEIGLPYGTSYWQVGDSSEQNGSFKMKLTKEKVKLTANKSDAGLAFEVDKRDIVKLVSDCWKESFAKVESNKKAVLTRGWGPKTLSYNVLLHKEITATKQSNEASSSSQLTSGIDPSNLNLKDGLAGTLLERICLKYNEDSQRNGSTAEERKKKRQETAKEKLEKHEKRVSSGLLVSSGQYRIDKTVYGYVKRAEDKKIEKQRSEERKKRENYFRLLEKVQKIREKSSSPEKWNSSELGTMIQWYRRKGDAKIPTTVAERRQRYHDVCGRGDPPVPELVASDEDGLAAVEAGGHEIPATVAAAGIEIAAADEFAASDDDTSEALVLLQHEV